MHPKQIVITKLLEMGFNVSIPIGDNCPYDIIVDNNRLIKIQIKTARINPNGSIEFNAFANRNNRNVTYKKYYDNLIDYFIFYELVGKFIGIVKPNDCKKQAKFGTVKKKSYKKRGRFFLDFELTFDKVV